MTKIDVINKAGEKISEAELNAKVFGIEKLDPSLVHFAVRAQRNNARKSNAHTKNRGEVAGSGKKPWKQKGTGRARAGSVRSPLWRHGGVTFGPRNIRIYSIKLNRSVFKKSMATVLTDKVKEKKFAVIDAIESTGKAKDLMAFIKPIIEKLNFGKRILIIIDKPDVNLKRAVSNLPMIKCAVARNLNIVDILASDILATKDAVLEIEKNILK
jgi:large subunit ribosomal protein L4